MSILNDTNKRRETNVEHFKQAMQKEHERAKRWEVIRAEISKQLGNERASQHSQGDHFTLQKFDRGLCALACGKTGDRTNEQIHETNVVTMKTVELLNVAFDDSFVESVKQQENNLRKRSDRLSEEVVQNYLDQMISDRLNWALSIVEREMELRWNIQEGISLTFLQSRELPDGSNRIAFVNTGENRVGVLKRDGTFEVLDFEHSTARQFADQQVKNGNMSEQERYDFLFSNKIDKTNEPLMREFQHMRENFHQGYFGEQDSQKPQMQFFDLNPGDRLVVLSAAQYGPYGFHDFKSLIRKNDVGATEKIQEVTKQQTNELTRTFSLHSLYRDQNRALVFNPDSIDAGMEKWNEAETNYRIAFARLNMIREIGNFSYTRKFDPLPNVSMNSGGALPIDVFMNTKRSMERFLKGEVYAESSLDRINEKPDLRRYTQDALKRLSALIKFEQGFREFRSVSGSKKYLKNDLSESLNRENQYQQYLIQLNERR